MKTKFNARSLSSLKNAIAKNNLKLSELPRDQRRLIESMLRVNQAGELGAGTKTQKFPFF